ncbi:MAG: ABC transporter permease [Rhodospirillaceae bacterium]|nr:ABC transporter permease [Rhodospirillaceae bacterium]
MTLAAFASYMLTGLAGASSLFLVAAGLSLIFGVTRVVNFAHGSFFMLGLYLAVTLAGVFGRTPLGFWGAVVCASLAVGAIGVVVERLILRPLYAAPELLQLLATFAVVLIVKDAALWIWGPEDLLGPRAPGLSSAVPVLGRSIPEYDLLLIALGPLVMAGLWLLLTRTRFGRLIRAATEDREMTAALGIDQARLFTLVFALGSALAGLGGALQLPREPANLSLDLSIVADAFVVVVLGGLGSLPGAFLASLLIAELKAFCIGLGFSKATLVIEFLVMAVVLVFRPHGLLGRPDPPARATEAEAGEPIPPLVWIPVALALAFPLLAGGYAVILAIDIVILALFAASLRWLIGPAGLVSFGHAAFFGLGAYAAAIAALKLGWPMAAALAAAPLVAAFGAFAFGLVAVRLSGVYLAMLSLAFAQIVWSLAFQWDALTGGSNGLVGIWPAAAVADKTRYYALVLGLAIAAWLLLGRIERGRLGYAIRAARDSQLRAEALGFDVPALRRIALVISGAVAGLAGGLFVYSKGSLSPETLAIPRSVDGLVMVLLGGLASPLGPLLGAGLFTWLQDEAARRIEFWRALVGFVILALVLFAPRGLAGLLRRPRA